MKPHWTELLPVDRFAVRVTNHLGEREYKTLHFLYQPLIGPTAISLYNTLSSRIEKDCFWSEEATHHELMALLNMPLDDIFDARRLLEGIGLLRTFRRLEETSTVFVYELQIPLNPAQFFQDDVLSVYLYNKLGKKRYLEMRERFMIETIDEEEYNEVTASFNEVFTSLHYSEMMIKEEEPELSSHQVLIGEEGSQEMTWTETAFDFSLLKADLPAFINQDKLLTEKARAFIQRLAFVYRIGPLDMSRLIQQSLSSDDCLSENELRSRVQEWYRFEHSSKPPALGIRSQSPVSSIPVHKEPANEKEKMKQFYEQTSPLTFLKSISDGAHVPSPDVRLVEMLVFDYQLQPGVVNVLIDFIMQTNNMKLNKNLVQKIAGHWSRKKIDTVDKAMELAKKEYQDRKERKRQVENGQGSYKPFVAMSPYVRKDKLPKWLESENKKVQKEEKAQKENSETSPELSEEMQEFENMLKMRKSIRQK